MKKNSDLAWDSTSWNLTTHLKTRTIFWILSILQIYISTKENSKDTDLEQQIFSNIISDLYKLFYKLDIILHMIQKYHTICNL